MSIRQESENYRYWTKDEDELITELVNKATPLRDICKIMNRSYSSCSCRSSGLGLYNRYTGPKKYSVNDFFWDEPNSTNCYYAGILAADGCIKLNNKRFKNVGVLSWETHIQDKVLLDSFKKDTNYTGGVNLLQRKDGIWHSYLRIHNENWNKNLIEKFNIVQNKTFRVFPPNNLSEQLLFCWLIGYIDGDGTVFIDKNNKTFVIKVTSSSEKLIYWIYYFLLEKFKQQIRNKPVSIPRKLKNTTCWEVSVCGVRAFCLYSYLQQFKLPKLERKWNQKKINDILIENKNKYPHFFDFNYLPTPIS